LVTRQKLHSLLARHLLVRRGIDDAQGDVGVRRHRRGVLTWIWLRRVDAGDDPRDTSGPLPMAVTVTPT
jgi:hypothetical protein